MRDSYITEAERTAPFATSIRRAAFRRDQSARCAGPARSRRQGLRRQGRGRRRARSGRHPQRRHKAHCSSNATLPGTAPARRARPKTDARTAGDPTPEHCPTNRATQSHADTDADTRAERRYRTSEPNRKLTPEVPLLETAEITDGTLAQSSSNCSPFSLCRSSEFAEPVIRV